MTIDSLDKQLVSLLRKDARQSSEALAKQLNVSASSVRRRVQKLVSDGVIRIIAYPDAGKIGTPLIVLLGFDVAHDRVDSVLNWLNSREEVSWLSVVSGRYDIMAAAWFASTDHLYHFLEKEVGALGGVVNTETFFCIHMVKAAGGALEKKPA